ncbi:MAG: hypothetical protein JO051_08315 [Acidobacteriaceae bacterium]|nr:hypothetical protein [Acidobacteriaceae bacterium]
MPYNLLLLPLLGGFLFFFTAHLFRFGAQRLEGYKLLFQSAIAGVILSFVARLIVLAIALTPARAWLEHAWFIFSPFPYSASSALAMILGPLAALILNLFVGTGRAKEIEVRRNANALIRLFYEATNQNFMVSVTMDSRKWYVGWIVETPSLYPQEQYFRLLPYMSGYRDSSTLETFRTVFYEDVLNTPEFDKGELVLTLPLTSVKIAGRFNVNVYNEYFAEPEEDEAAATGGTTGA